MIIAQMYNSLVTERENGGGRWALHPHYQLRQRWTAIGIRLWVPKMSIFVYILLYYIVTFRIKMYLFRLGSNLNIENCVGLLTAQSVQMMLAMRLMWWLMADYHWCCPSFMITASQRGPATNHLSENLWLNQSERKGGALIDWVRVEMYSTYMGI